MFVFLQKQPNAIGLCWQMDCNVLSRCLALPGKWLLCFPSGVLFRCQVFQKSNFPSWHKSINCITTVASLFSLLFSLSFSLSFSLLFLISPGFLFPKDFLYKSGLCWEVLSILVASVEVTVFIQRLQTHFRCPPFSSLIEDERMRDFRQWGDRLASLPDW